MFKKSPPFSSPSAIGEISLRGQIEMKIWGDKRYRPVRRVVLHTSSDESLREIERKHRRRGLKQIGFHYVIRESGLLERGRPLDLAGAHCLGYNADSIAICLCGNGRVNGEQWVRMKRLLIKLHRRYPLAELARVGELDPWAEDPLQMDVSFMRKETGL